jgi:putative acetyltransferase
MRIAIERPDQPAIIALIDALDAFQMPLYPAESHHGIDMAALTAPGVLFAVARDAAHEVRGCGAVVLMSDYGELKRMYVPPESRGRGLGAALLGFLEQQALAHRCRLLRLETGFRQPDALRLYARAGYIECAPFGDYRPDPNSVFMEKSL